MGTWGPNIDEDDVFVDIYQSFFEAYNDGESPDDLIGSIRSEFTFYFDNEDDYSPALYALALAAWETKSLPQELLEEVRSRVDSGKDIQNYREREATDEHLQLRLGHLAGFIDKISQPRKTKKRRVKRKDDFSSIRLIDLDSPDRLKHLLVDRISLNGEYYCTSASVEWYSGVGGGLFGFSEDNISITANWLTNGRLAIKIDGKCHTQQKIDRLQAFQDVVEIAYDAPEMTSTI